MPSDVIINKPLSKQTMYIIAGSVIVLVIVLVGVVIFLMNNKSSPTKGPTTPPITGTTTPPIRGTTTTPATGLLFKKEVYYLTDAQNDSNPNMLTFEYASALARTPTISTNGGEIATPEQIRAAWSAGLDACWKGWASDGKKYMSINSDWGAQGGANFCKISGVTTDNWVGHAGVWIYGVKPPKNSMFDCNNSTQRPCIVPFSKKKWSQYDI